ncbi:hypothetical protein PoB_000193200 [Plakobranchus ocellatus]|uniref:Uncharacterized protein n=1 Tax=Plakobranchus ocellatus TaxID=259542 RepID=A0AAV3Y006_9GAST|nr:hypothetical protein PoB_000193200 [Plakobranchus ocellatus]
MAAIRLPARLIASSRVPCSAEPCFRKWVIGDNQKHENKRLLPKGRSLSISLHKERMISKKAKINVHQILFRRNSFLLGQFADVAMHRSRKKSHGGFPAPSPDDECPSAPSPFGGATGDKRRLLLYKVGIYHRDIEV